jgi:hypothetical protein
LGLRREGRNNDASAGQELSAIHLDILPAFLFCEARLPQDAGQPAYTALCAPPFHQDIRFALFVAAAVGPLDLAKPARALAPV